MVWNMFNGNNKNTKTTCQWRRCGVFIVNFEYISHLFLVFLLLILNKSLFAGYICDLILHEFRKDVEWWIPLPIFTNFCSDVLFYSFFLLLAKSFFSNSYAPMSCIGRGLNKNWYIYFKKPAFFPLFWLTKGYQEMKESYRIHYVILNLETSFVYIRTATLHSFFQQI